MMTSLMVLILILAVRSFMLPGAAEGLRFYLIPDFSRITGKVVVNAMNQAFFTLSVGMGGMAIFGSYIGKEHSLMGELVRIILLDCFVAVTAGLIIFPACFTYGLEVTAGPSLLFDTMANVFDHMEGGRWWGTLFCCNSYGWGFEQFMQEANTGHGIKVKKWMKPVFRYVVPIAILFIYIYGLITFNWK